MSKRSDRLQNGRAPVHGVEVDVLREDVNAVDEDSQPLEVDCTGLDNKADHKADEVCFKKSLAFFRLLWATS